MTPEYIEGLLRDIRIRNDIRFYRVLSYRARLKALGYGRRTRPAYIQRQPLGPMVYRRARNRFMLTRRAETWIRRAVPTEWEAARLREIQMMIACDGKDSRQVSAEIDAKARNAHMQIIARGQVYEHGFARVPWYRRLWRWLAPPPPEEW